MRSTAVIVALLVLVGCRRDAPPRQGATASRPTQTQPVVVELFTSQGCSSCPPADRLLSAIGDGALGENVIPLAFHVDYWNYIGWRDPFSSAEASARQRRYGREIADRRVYTPMLVVDGRAHVVGSIPGRVSAAIARARRRPPSGWAIEIAGAGISKGRVTAEVTTRGPGSGGPIQLWVAVRQSGLQTAVSRGENAGEILTNDFIVRELVPLDSERRRQRIELELPEGDADSRSLVVLVQDPSTLAMLAAAVTELSAI